MNQKKIVMIEEDALDLLTEMLFNGIPTKKTYLEYRLEPIECGCEFQIYTQAPEVTTFLSKKPFMASNGLQIELGEFPEFKDSKNKIYLRGYDKSQDLKVDTTRFIRNSVRDSKMGLVNAALKELVEAVKKNSGSPLCYQNPLAANKRYFRSIS